MAGRARWRKAARSASTRVGVVWFLFQSTIILAVVQSNISWRWADGGVQVGVIGVGLAYLATLIVSGWGRPQIRGEKIVLKMTTKVVVSTAAVIAAAGLCWQMAVAQAEIDRLTPRPPLPIPNVVALMPPTARLVPSAPTPIQHAFGAFDGRGSLASDLGYESIAGFDPGGLQSAYPGVTSAPAAPARPAPTADRFHACPISS